MRLDGKIAATSIKEQLKKEFASLSKRACLAIVHYDDPASASYLKGRLKIAEELGVEIKIFNVDEKQTTEDLISLVLDLNNDANIDGIMVDRPLPKQFDENKVFDYFKHDCELLINYLKGNKFSRQDYYVNQGCFNDVDYYLKDFDMIDFFIRNTIR